MWHDWNCPIRSRSTIDERGRRDHDQRSRLIAHRFTTVDLHLSEEGVRGEMYLISVHRMYFNQVHRMYFNLNHWSRGVITFQTKTTHNASR